MKIVIMDGQGGNIGRELVRRIKEALPECELTAVGTNSAATAAMLKAGADHAATGENAVLVAARSADILAGPIGIVIADAMYGEVTPEMARAVGQSRARRILIPISHCDSLIPGTEKLGLSFLIEETVKEIVDENKKRSA